MLQNLRFFKSWIPSCLLVFVAAVSMVNAQDETLADIKYKEDYDRIQAITKISDIVIRADKMVAFYSERHDVDSKLQDYIDNLFARDLETLTKRANYVVVQGVSERVLKLRPRFGEVYLFYGVALKNSKKVEEAMNAFARGASIPNALSTKAKQQLDIAYRAVNGGSLVGQDKLIKNAMKDLK
jgi:hypothetical protein